MSVRDEASIRPYVPPEADVPPESEPSSPPRLIPLAAAIRQRQALEQPVDSPEDSHDLFGIFCPVDEETGSDVASEVAAAIIPGPFFSNATTLDTREQPEPVPSDVEALPMVSGRIEEAFRPLLEVDHFAWPAICQRLDEEADEEINLLTDAMVAAMRRGQTAIGMAGCRRGEGSTTLLLSAARRLSELRLRVALVDAHFTRPELTGRLGLLPENGWVDVLGERLPLAEVAIESVEERLTVVPLHQPVGRAETDAETEGDQPSAMEKRMLETIDTLADHYDLVLVDVGPLDELTALGGVLAGRLDAIVLVHNPNITSEDRLAETQHHLASVQIAQMGIVRNFVRVQAIACG